MSTVSTARTVGRVTIEALQLPRDVARLHAWVTHPKAVYWEMQGATVHDVATEYALIDEDPHHDAWLGRVDGEPAFLVETYDPFHSELAALPELRTGDLGMHLLVAPAESPVPGFSRAVFRRVMEHCFADADVRRVVVEPDVRNERIATLNTEAGFDVVRTVRLRTKEAALSFCSRASWKRSDLCTR